MVTQQWLDPGAGLHEILPVHVTADRAAGRLVTAYAARRADGRTSVLLLNKDPRRTARVQLAGVPETPRQMTTLSAATYVWHPSGDHGDARPDLPPVRTSLAGTPPDRLPCPRPR